MAVVRRLERRLAAVLAMDIAGYSRLMSLDEVGTHGRVRDNMLDMIEPAIAQGGGRIVKTTGDGALTEFPEASKAVQCAAIIQRSNELAEQEYAVEQRIRFRIGISLGDIIVEEDDIYGDGVNIAVRLESIAEVGGIYMSEAAAKASTDSGFIFLDLGLKSLKNITRPIRVYKVALSGEVAETGPIVGASLVQGFGERPAIAVLPFRSDGIGPDDEPFADGLTEDVITALSRWRSFPVISRASVFAFKGKDLDLKFVAQHLGARYINEGTLRRRGHRLRAITQLSDIETTETSVRRTIRLRDRRCVQDAGRNRPHYRCRDRARAAEARARACCAGAAAECNGIRAVSAGPVASLSIHEGG